MLGVQCLHNDLVWPGFEKHAYSFGTIANCCLQSPLLRTMLRASIEQGENRRSRRGWSRGSSISDTGRNEVVKGVWVGAEEALALNNDAALFPFALEPLTMQRS